MAGPARGPHTGTRQPLPLEVASAPATLGAMDGASLDAVADSRARLRAVGEVNLSRKMVAKSLVDEYIVTAAAAIDAGVEQLAPATQPGLFDKASAHAAPAHLRNLCGTSDHAQGDSAPWMRELAAKRRHKVRG